MFPKIGVPPNHPFNRFSIINHPFWGTPIFGNPHFPRKKWCFVIDLFFSQRHCKMPVFFFHPEEMSKMLIIFQWTMARHFSGFWKIWSWSWVEVYFLEGWWVDVRFPAGETRLKKHWGDGWGGGIWVWRVFLGTSRWLHWGMFCFQHLFRWMGMGGVSLFST